MSPFSIFNLFRGTKLPKRSMRTFARFPQTLCLLCLVGAIRLAFSQCLLTNGMEFKKHHSKMLHVTPFEIMEIAYFLECLSHCEAKQMCRSVNIRQKARNLICELLAVNTNDAALIANDYSTHYEDVTIFKVQVTLFYK